jgi:hypothetical protein
MPKHMPPSPNSAAPAPIAVKSAPSKSASPGPLPGRPGPAPTPLRRLGAVALLHATPCCTLRRQAARFRSIRDTDRHRPLPSPFAKHSSKARRGISAGEWDQQHSRCFDPRAPTHSRPCASHPLAARAVTACPAPARPRTQPYDAPPAPQSAAFKTSARRRACSRRRHRAARAADESSARRRRPTSLPLPAKASAGQPSPAAVGHAGAARRGGGRAGRWKTPRRAGGRDGDHFAPR